MLVQIILFSSHHWPVVGSGSFTFLRTTWVEWYYHRGFTLLILLTPTSTLLQISVITYEENTTPIAVVIKIIIAIRLFIIL